MPLRENLLLDRMPHQPRPDLADAQSHLLKRAELLLDKDRLMVELALKNRLTHRQLAQVLSIPPGTVCRRLRRVINRLCDPTVLALLDSRNPLQQEHRELALEFMLQGQTTAQLAERHQMSVAQVRRILEYVRGWHRGMTGAQARRHASERRW